MLHFIGQHDTEEVLVITRPHVIVFWGKAATAATLVLLVFAAWVLLKLGASALLSWPYQGVAALAAVLYLYAVWAFFFLSWSQYWFDVAIVTTERIVKIEQYSVFRREISEFRISKVQDVRVDVAGVLATLLGFGNLVIETAGEGPAFVFERIPHPEQIKDIILRQQASPPPNP